MNTFVVYTFSPYRVPKIQSKEIMGSDILTALQGAPGSGIDVSEVICVKLKAVSETVVGL